MPFDHLVASPGATVDALARAIADAKGSDRLAPVTVVVRTNVSGVMARRALGRDHGVLGVDMLTLNRLAELIAGPSLAAHRRRPVSSPVLELTVRRVLDDDPGAFRRVAQHPSTVAALRDLHAELRLAGSSALDELAATSRGRNVVRVSRAVDRLLAARWYDEADLFTVATRLVAEGVPPSLGQVVVHLPDRLPALARDFVAALAARIDVTVVSCLTGAPSADEHPLEVVEQLVGAAAPAPITAPAPPPPHPATTVVSTTDADDEVATAIRVVVDAARGELTGVPVPFERIAVVWPSHQPYARLVEHHLGAADVPWNGRGGTELSERLAPRLLLDLLDVDRRGIRRRELFELLADIPARSDDGAPHPTAAWERVSRLAGVSDDGDWAPRLASLARNERWTDTAESLADFVDRLRRTLGPRSATRPWKEWVDWSVEQIEGWLGAGAVTRMSDPEYRAWEALMAALEQLRGLDEISDPVSRTGFRAVLEAEIDAGGVREGRIGTGVTVGSLAAAAGLDVDVAVVLGAADGLLPPAPRSDPLLSDADRHRAGLSRSDERARRLHHEFESLVRATHTVVTVPRGDLRTTTRHQPSRWLADLQGALHVESASHAAGLAASTFAPSEREHRLGALLRTNRAEGPAAVAAHGGDLDAELRPRLAMLAGRARAEVTEFDGDLSASDVPTLGDVPVSPTRIEQWVACPHAYFVSYLLGVRPVDEPDDRISISPLDRGLVQHETLDRLHHDVIDGRLPQPTSDGWTDEHRDALLAHFDEVCELYRSLGRTGRPATWSGERARMRADLLAWLEHDSRRCIERGVTVLDSEHGFPEADGAVTIPLPDGRPLAVRGSIDRLDRSADGVLVVTDHKTGKDTDFRKLSGDDPTLGGTRFQLATYAAAAVARFGEGPDALDTVRVRSEYSMFERGGYKRIGYETDPEVWQTIRRDLGRVVDGIESGWFPQVPERPGFRMWPSCWYCEPDGLGTAEAWDRWSRKRHDERLARWFADPDDTGEPDETGADTGPRSEVDGDV